MDNFTIEISNKINNAIAVAETKLLNEWLKNHPEYTKEDVQIREGSPSIMVTKKNNIFKFQKGFTICVSDEPSNTKYRSWDDHSILVSLDLEE